MIARRHHYVPRCYLKGFSVARKKSRQVVVFDCKSGKSFATATENIAVEKDFNRVEIEGHPPDVFEKAMSEFESEVASALERTIAAKSIRQVDDRAYLFNLIGLLALRNPGQRERWRDFREQMAKRIMDLASAIAVVVAACRCYRCRRQAVLGRVLLPDFDHRCFCKRYGHYHPVANSGAPTRKT
jgi:Protein of unknown function (DUF4238)